ncbi:hypothetical protein [Thermoflavimicrobium dichotomicum]|uniref:Uncharacterized protein n=1 Tax=Thermoflavimicrobium dichotomicum TaxID=46223 RepID=A0A1I3JNV3_9BACL|nr:hypothetical protein [Thermoflavimicrobium dichotomicum]SFI61678.1 hypothetical protein SAMN05421852_101137 [Thermoflavimicrobium dichotomicum]
MKKNNRPNVRFEGDNYGQVNVGNVAKGDMNVIIQPDDYDEINKVKLEHGQPVSEKGTYPSWIITLAKIYFVAEKLYKFGLPIGILIMLHHTYHYIGGIIAIIGTISLMYCKIVDFIYNREYYLVFVAQGVYWTMIYYFSKVTSLGFLHSFNALANAVAFYFAWSIITAGPYYLIQKIKGKLSGKKNQLTHIYVVPQEYKIINILNTQYNVSLGGNDKNKTKSH